MVHTKPYDWSKQAEFFSRYPLKRFDKGQMILFSGQEPECAFILESGIVNAYIITNDGTEKPIAFLREHDMMPMGWIFNDNPMTEHFFVAHTECQMHCVPKQDLIQHIQGDPELLYVLFERLSRRLMNDLKRIQALEQSRAVDKVAQMFLFLTAQYGIEVAENTVKVDLPLTQADLANLMGLTRETVGIELKKLEQKGIIEHKSHIFTVRAHELKKTVDENA